MPSCSIKQCRARRTSNPGLTLHRLPTNKTMKSKWLEIIGAENLNTNVKELYVCSMHFDESSINRTLEVSRLKDGAMPSSSLLPKSIKFSKQRTSNNMVHKINKTSSCENKNKARSPCPVQSDMSEDSSPEDTLVEKAINPPGLGASCTTFAKAWSPVQESSAPTAAASTNTNSPAPTTIPPSTKKTQEYLHTIIIQRQNSKIKNLTKRCQLYQRKVRSLNEKIRRRDLRISQLSYIIKRLKDNICFNNEGTIILEESEIPEGLAEDANAKIRNFDDCTSSSSIVIASNQVSLPRSSAGNKPLPNGATTPDPPPSATGPTQLPISVLALNKLKLHESTNLFKESKSSDLMFVISPLTINKKPKERKSRDLKLNNPPLKNKTTLKSHAKAGFVKNTTSKGLTSTIPPIPDKKSLKRHKSTDNIKETTSKDTKLKNTSVINEKTEEPHESTNLIKETTTKDITVKSSGTNNNAFIYIIEVD